MTLARHHACSNNSVLCIVAHVPVIQLINLQSEDPHPVLEKDTQYSINNKEEIFISGFLHMQNGL